MPPARKFTTALRYRISIMMLRKLKLKSDNPIMHIEFSGHFYYPPEHWVLIPVETYKKLTQGEK